MPNLLVTGKWGEPHVTSAQQRNYNAGIAGDGQYVMSGMTATMTNSNTCHIDPGVASFNGADVEVPAGGVDLTIENGTQGQKRNDLVVLRYTKNPGSQVEDVSLAVIKGTPTSGTAADPAHNEGSILDGDSPCDMPLWRIPLNGIDVGDPVQLFKDFESISDLRETISPIMGIGFRAARSIEMPNAGKWNIGNFDFMAGIDPGDVLYVSVEISTCQTSSEGVYARWNTNDGRNDIEIISPISQYIYINVLVMYSVAG